MLTSATNLGAAVAQRRRGAAGVRPGRAGWQLSHVPDVVAHCRASRLRDTQLHRRYDIRDALWFTWIRRPLYSAIIRTIRLLCRLPRDRVGAQGVADALRGLPWVPRERDPVPEDLERAYGSWRTRTATGTPESTLTG